MYRTKLSRAYSKTKLYLQRSSPTILTCIAASGVIVSSVMAAKATPKALALLEKVSGEKGGELTTLETVLTAAPAYIPSVVVGMSTIACIFGANILNKQKQAALVSAYALVNNSFKEYRKKLIELHGEEADVEVKNAIARECCNYHQLRLDAPDNKVVFYDEISGESITCYEREVMDAEYHLNRNFTIRGYAFLNEFYEFLGLPMTDYGGTVGWSVASGIMWIDFEHRLIEHDDGGLDLYSINMVFQPDILKEWEC